MNLLLIARGRIFTFSVVLLFAISAQSHSAEFDTFYRVKDIQGNPILETQDTSILKQLKNVTVDTVKENFSLLIINSPEYIDSLKNAMHQSLGKPQKSKISYEMEWKTPNNGLVILTKSETGKQYIKSDFNGRIWLRSTFKNFDGRK
jgi:hypothetical protein